MGLFSSKFDPETDIPNLSGRVAIVTGGNSGIGIYTVLYLVRRGATVYLGARSKDKADEAIARLRKEGLGSSPGEIKWLDLNLTDPRAAKQAAVWFLTQETRLDILVNNAGKITSNYGLTPDGISDSVMINHISPFIFTQTLLPLMETTSKAGGDVRIINISSMTHSWISEPRYDSIEALNNDFSHTRAPRTTIYAYTKLANVLYTKELQRRLDKENKDIIVMAVHPGMVFSEGNVNLFRTYPCGRFLVWLSSIVFVTTSVGALPSIFAAASPAVREDSVRYKGSYLVPGNKVQESSADSNSRPLAEELWGTTEKVLSQLKV